MSWFSLAFGVGWLALGAYYLARRTELAERSGRGTTLRVTPRFFGALGCLFLLLGLLAFADAHT